MVAKPAVRKERKRKVMSVFEREVRHRFTVQTIARTKLLAAKNKGFRDKGFKLSKKAQAVHEQLSLMNCNRSFVRIFSILLGEELPDVEERSMWDIICGAAVRIVNPMGGYKRGEIVILIWTGNSGHLKVDGSVGRAVSRFYTDTRPATEDDIQEFAVKAPIEAIHFALGSITGTKD